MIEVPTVLILGAGASVPYGLPSGRKLMLDILKHLDPTKGSKLPGALRRLEIKANTIKSFYKSLYYSGRSSVDSFLEHRSEFLEIGKLAISLCLIPYENEDKLFNRDKGESSWYEYLFNKLNAPFNSIDKNKLSIITFNYDRSIEHYLFTVLKNAYGKSDEDCAEKLNKVPIIHVHGRLGALPWQGGLTRKYDPNPFFDEIKNISEQIVVIPQKKQTSAEFKVAFELMSSAKKIYFLGFGYHDDNLKRLRIKEFKKKQPMGTTLGLGMAEKKVVELNWGIKVESTFGEVLEFLKNYAVLR